jgi:hypothetical protein
MDNLLQKLSRIRNENISLLIVDLESILQTGVALKLQTLFIALDHCGLCLSTRNGLGKPFAFAIESGQISAFDIGARFVGMTDRSGTGTRQQQSKRQPGGKKKEKKKERNEREGDILAKVRAIFSLFPARLSTGHLGFLDFDLVRRGRS